MLGEGHDHGSDEPCTAAETSDGRKCFGFQADPDNPKIRKATLVLDNCPLHHMTPEQETAIRLGVLHAADQRCLAVDTCSADVAILILDASLWVAGRARYNG